MHQDYETLALPLSYTGEEKATHVKEPIQALSRVEREVSAIKDDDPNHGAHVSEDHFSAGIPPQSRRKDRTLGVSSSSTRVPLTTPVPNSILIVDILGTEVPNWAARAVQVGNVQRC